MPVSLMHPVLGSTWWLTPGSGPRQADLGKGHQDQQVALFHFCLGRTWSHRGFDAGLTGPRAAASILSSCFPRLWAWIWDIMVTLSWIFKFMIRASLCKKF